MNYRALFGLGITLIVLLGSASGQNTSSPPEEKKPAENFIAPVVQKLLSMETRDEAYRQIIRQQKYRGEAKYKETNEQPVDHVVVCPQTKGPPMFAVFPVARHQKPNPHQTAGHFFLIDSEGAIVSVYHGSNSLEGQLKDVNLDGVIDVVESWRIGSFEELPKTIDERKKQFKKAIEKRRMVLHIIPVTPEQRPVLSIAYNGKNISDPWSWEIAEVTARPPNQRGSSQKKLISVIQLGPVDEATGDIVPKAAYRWSSEKKDYIGPSGGVGQEFMRLNTTRTDEEMFGEMKDFFSN